MASVERRLLQRCRRGLFHEAREAGWKHQRLRTAAEMHEGRLRVRSTLVVQVLPPFIFVIVGILVGSLMAMMMTTLLTLVRGLS